MLLIEIQISRLNASEWILLFLLFIGVAKEFIAEGLFRERQTVLVSRKVDIVAPLGPPRCSNQKLSVSQASKVRLEHERILHLSHGQFLVALYGPLYCSLIVL